MNQSMGKFFSAAIGATVGAVLLGLASCTSIPPSKPVSWSKPEVLVAPSSFSGVHGLAIDQKGRLLAGSVVGYELWEVNRTTGSARVMIPAPEGQADDIAVGSKEELAWTNYLMGMVRYRENDSAPMKVLAKDLPGLNSLDFDRRNGKLYASQVFLGDAIWELDVSGAKPPRLVAKDVGGFNGFEVGPDGMLYGPLWFKGQVVKIDPSNGAVTVINSQFQTPAAANLDGKGNLWVIDTKTGELSKVELANGRKTVMKQLKTAIDNLAIAPDGTIYVSNMADNGIDAYNPATGEVRNLTSGKLAVPAGLRYADGSLYVADIFAFRKVDANSGAVTDLARMQASDMEYPFGVGISKSRITLTSWFTGTLQVIDRATLKTDTMVHGFKAPMDSIPMDDGSVLVIEIATGNLLRVSGAGFKEQKVVAAGLAGPVQMTMGSDGAVYVTEAAGKLTRVNLTDGSKTAIAEGLLLPEGVAQTPWGSFIVAETAAKRLVEIDANGSKRTIAENLPIGLPAGPGMPPPFVATGVAVDPKGVIYFSADRNNAIYRITPQR